MKQKRLNSNFTCLTARSNFICTYCYWSIFQKREIVQWNSYRNIWWFPYTWGTYSKMDQNHPKMCQIDGDLTICCCCCCCCCCLEIIRVILRSSAQNMKKCLEFLMTWRKTPRMGPKRRDFSRKIFICHTQLHMSL